MQTERESTNLQNSESRYLIENSKKTTYQMLNVNAPPLLLTALCKLLGTDDTFCCYFKGGVFSDSYFM